VNKKAPRYSYEDLRFFVTFSTIYLRIGPYKQVATESTKYSDILYIRAVNKILGMSECISEISHRTIL